MALASPPRMDCWVVVRYPSCCDDRHSFWSAPVVDDVWLLIPSSCGRLAMADRMPIESGFSDALVSEASAESMNSIVRDIFWQR